MSESNANGHPLERILQRERAARKRAETIIEEKSRELYMVNEELRSLNASLEDRIAERTAELERINSELIVATEAAQASSKAKSQFLSTVSHEIRTPLNVIIGLTDILRKGDHPPKTKEILERIKFSSDTLLSLINDVLDLSAIESGKLTTDKVVFDLAYLCERVCDNFSQKAEDKGLTLDCMLDRKLPPAVEGDASKLNQVLTNLIGNAIKFTESGSVALYVKRIGADADTVRLRFDVDDTGIGISPDKLDRIFGEFVQEDASTRTQYGGTGLGLNIVKKLIELQHGKVWVTSDPGHGSRFSFELSYAIANSAQQPVTRSRQELTLPQGMRILLAEDLEINQFLMKEMLNGSSVELTLVTDGKQALEAVQSSTFDVVLLDMHMPVMDGLTAARAIRELPDAQGRVHIISLTADVFSDTREALLQAGVNDFLSKPVNPDALYRALNKAVKLG